MSKAKELLEKLEAEIFEKTNAEVLERDAEIKEAAQVAYDTAVEAAVAKIKTEVEGAYKIAKDYLLEIVESEPVEVESAPTETIVIEEV